MRRRVIIEMHDEAGSPRVMHVELDAQVRGDALERAIAAAVEAIGGKRVAHRLGARAHEATR